MSSVGKNDEMPGLCFGFDDEMYSVPYPEWMLERTTYEARSEAMRAALFGAGLQGASAIADYSAIERQRFLAGQPNFHLGMHDATEVNYLIVVMLLLMDERVKAVVQ